MTSREFLNVAHTTLVEEVMRPHVLRGMTIPGMSLEEALERTAFWGEGYQGDLPLAVTDEQQQETGAVMTEPRQKTEEEMVAQNEAAMQALMARMSNVKGGFGLKPATAN